MKYDSILLYTIFTLVHIAIKKIYKMSSLFFNGISTFSVYLSNMSSITRIFIIALHLNPVVVNGMRTIYPRGLNRGSVRSSRERVDSWIRYKTAKEDRRSDQPKRLEYNNENEDNMPNTLSDKKRYYF